MGIALAMVGISVGMLGALVADCELYDRHPMVRRVACPDLL